MIWGNLDKRDVQVAAASGAAACVGAILVSGLLSGELTGSGGMWLLYPFFGLPASFALNLILLIIYERALAPILKFGDLPAAGLGAAGAFVIAFISYSIEAAAARAIYFAAMAAMAAIGSGAAFCAYFAIAERTSSGVSRAIDPDKTSAVGVASHLAAYISAAVGVAILYAVGSALRGTAPEDILPLVFWGAVVPYLCLIGLMHALELYQRIRQPLSDQAVISIAVSLAAVTTAAFLFWSASRSTGADPLASLTIVVAGVVVAAAATSAAFRVHLRFRSR